MTAHFISWKEEVLINASVRLPVLFVNDCVNVS